MKILIIEDDREAAAYLVKGFREAFEKGGGKVLEDLTVPFPNVEFQALLTEIAAKKPDVVFAFELRRVAGERPGIYPDPVARLELLDLRHWDEAPLFAAAELVHLRLPSHQRPLVRQEDAPDAAD